MRKRFFSVVEASSLLRVSYDQVWWACATGRIKPEVVGRSRLLTQKDIEDLRKLFEQRKQRCEK